MSHAILYIAKRRVINWLTELWEKKGCCQEIILPLMGPIRIPLYKTYVSYDYLTTHCINGSTVRGSRSLPTSVTPHVLRLGMDPSTSPLTRPSTHVVRECFASRHPTLTSWDFDALNLSRSRQPTFSLLSTSSKVWFKVPP